VFVAVINNVCPALKKEVKGVGYELASSS
jgi:hypothetical protein